MSIMRSIFFFGCMAALSGVLVACGQTGALIKPSAQGDKRSDYLLHKFTKPATAESTTSAQSPSSDLELGQQP